MTFQRYAETVAEKKDVKQIIKEAFEQSDIWKRAKEKVDGAKEELKTIEQEIKSGLSKEVENLEQLKSEEENDKMLMSDQALSMLVKGEEVKVKNKNGVEFYGEFSVKFKKVK